MEPVAVRVKEAARLLALSARTVWALAAAGEIPSFHVGTSRLFSVDELRKWVAKRIDEARVIGGQP